MFDTKFGRLYADKGRPALATRLMVGLHYLKHAFNESDESVVARLLENGYWMYFCGFEFFIHRLPLDPSSLVRWRKRIGPKNMEQLLGETLETAKRGEHLTERHMERVNVDTTVQEKAIAYPTDARLYHKARVLLVKAAKERGIPLRQSYLRVGKVALIKSGRYAHARQMNRAKAEQKKVKNYLGRVYRNILRNCSKPDEQLAELLHLTQRLLTQQRNDKNKLYSLHAPEVECIGKGKAHKKFEFGCKVSVVTTSKDNWIVGVEALHHNPFDGHTLKGALKQVKRLVGWTRKERLLRQGLQGQSEAARWQHGHPSGDPAQEQHETERMALVQTTKRHRAGDRPHEAGPPDGSQLSQGHRRRPDERHPGRVWLQPEKAPASSSLASFQRAGTTQITDDAAHFAQLGAQGPG